MPTSKADDFGLAASRGIQATLATLGAPPVAATSYASTDKDMTAQLLEIRDKGADSLIIWGRPADVAIIVKQVSELGIDLPKIGNSSLVAPTTLANLTADQADGAYAIGGMIPQTSNDPKVLAWMKGVQERYKVPADNFAVAHDDAVTLLKDIIERVGCDKAAIRDALASAKDHRGSFIAYSADARGDLAHTLGLYRNRGRTPEFVGPINERAP